MTTPASPSAPKSSGDDRNFVAVDETYTALTFEDRLRIFWQKNGKAVILLVIVVLVGILAKGGWEYFEAQKEKEIGKEYAAAKTPEQLKSFAAKHTSHSLAGIARLRLADEAYAASKSDEAVSLYDEAVSALKTGPLASRAKLGAAMAKIQAGKADGEAALKQLASDTSQPKAIRVEANYHLASLASTTGKPDDVRKYSDQVMQIDPSSPWTQRALMLRANLPVSGPAAASTLIPIPPVAK